APVRVHHLGQRVDLPPDRHRRALVRPHLQRHRASAAPGVINVKRGGPMRRSVAVAGLLAASAALCLFTGPAASAGTRPATSLPHDTTQLIRVVAPSYGATYARFTGYSKVGRRWVRALGPWTAEIGYHGMAPPGAKREGDGRTPSGTYGFEFDFGVWPNPGIAFSFRRAHSYDVWDDDPSSSHYNEW